jgi:hypothetical protein
LPPQRKLAVATIAASKLLQIRHRCDNAMHKPLIRLKSPQWTAFGFATHAERCSAYLDHRLGLIERRGSAVAFEFARPPWMCLRGYARRLIRRAAALRINLPFVRGVGWPQSTTLAAAVLDFVKMPIVDS